MGQRWHGKGRGLYYSIEKGTKLINWEQDYFTPQNCVSS
jgi:hypothetical protein